VVGKEMTDMQDPHDTSSSSPLPSQPRQLVSDASLSSAARQAITDAPVLVRVELGEVSLSAQQWARVTPGSILTTGHPVGQQVILRVADVEVARGELVNVEGELGVRIQSLTGRKSGT
jgi:flagellar motor switch/type III secretory pathway protein FliN